MVTDEMVEAAGRTCSGAMSPREMRAAIEAAMAVRVKNAPDVVSTILKWAAVLDIPSGPFVNEDLSNAAACIEDLAAALRLAVNYPGTDYNVRLQARTTLAKWGLKG